MPHYELVKIEDKGNFILDLDDLISCSIYNNESWEYYLEQIYSKIIEKDFIIIDAGANIGYHSVLFSKLGKKVYSFEPVPYNFNLLCGNIALNNLSNDIIPFCVGLGDKEEKVGIVFQEEVELWWVNSKTTSHKNYGGTVIGSSADVKDLIVKPLDVFNLNPDFIKIDVEGYEFKLIEGATNTIKNSKPTILIEIHQDQIEKVSGILNSLGYNIYLIPSEPWNSDFICIHPESKHYEKTLKIIKEENLNKIQKINFG